MFFNNKSNRIYRNKLFQSVYPKQVKVKIRSKNFLRIPKGKYVYQVGDGSESVYLLVNGHVRLKFYESTKDSTIQDKFNYDFFGEHEILKQIPRKSSAVAVEKSLLYKLTSDEVKDIMQSKTIRANLDHTNPTITDELMDVKNLSKESDEVSIEELYQTEDSVQKTVSSESPASKTSHYGQSEDELTRNSMNSNELRNVLGDEVSLDSEGVEDISENKNIESDYRKDSANLLDNAWGDEPEHFHDTDNTIRKHKYHNESIIDQIKNDLTDESDSPHNRILNDNPILTNVSHSYSNDSDDGKLKDQNNTKTEGAVEETAAEETNGQDVLNPDQLSTNEIQELTKTIVDNICDEIQEPLNIIKKYAQLLINKSSSNEANKILQKIIDESNQILNSLSAHTSYLSEKLELKTQILQASNTLDDILHLIAGYTEFRNVKLYRKFEADASINVDKILLYQASLQIVKFLCENLPDEGNIFVTVNRTKAVLSIEFKNNGNKIPEEQITRLFEPFTQMNTPGLGLAHRIISKHDGKIDAKNSIDAGIQITVFLPIVN